MNLIHWLMKKLPRNNRSTRGQSSRKPKRLTLQSLEQRQLLAADAIGVVDSNGTWGIDDNRDGTVDIDRRFGLAGDQFVPGDWTGSGDQMGVARVRPDGFLQWYLNTDANVSPVHEVDFLYGLANDIAVAGDWDGNGTDNPAVVRKSASGGLDWYKDLNQDPNAELFQSFGLHGDIPVVGDWDNNGTDNVGVVRATGTGHLEWLLDTTGDSAPEVQRIFGLVGDTPVVGNWNDDGRIDIGVTRPVQVDGVTKQQWLLDTNGDPNPDLPAVILGNANMRPVTGRWQLSEVAVFANMNSSLIPIRGGQSGTDSIGFGTIISGNITSRTFTARNTGNSALTIQQPTVPAGFTVTEPLAGTLQPGQQDSFTISLNTSTPNNYGGEVRFLTSDGNESPFAFAIHGSVEARNPQIQVVSSVAFGDIVQNSTGTVGTKTITIENPGNVPLEYTSTLSGANYRIVSGGTGVVAPRGAQVLVVQLLTTSLGTQAGGLTIQSNAVSRPTVLVSLSGSIVAPNPLIQVQGNGAVGSVPLNSTGSTVERVFKVSNTGNAPISYTATLSNTNFAFVSGQIATVAPNTTVSLVVRMRTNSVGAKSATLTITSNATNTPTLTQSLTGSVTQSSSRIEVTGTGEFGNVAVGATGTTVTREFIVKNNGTAPLTYATTMTNSDFTIASGNQATVAVGGTSKIVVRMNTATVGPKSATLHITSNDPTKPNVSVAMSGQVNATGFNGPELNVTIGTTTLAPGQTGGLYFGATTSPAPTKSFVIRNSGAGVLNVTNAFIVGSVGSFTTNMPSNFSLASGQSRAFSVTMMSTSFATKFGQLLFSTNDTDESSVTIQLLGRSLPAPVTVPGGAINHSVYTIGSSSLNTIFIDPRHGRVEFDASYVISKDGGRTTHSGLLKTLIIESDQRPNVENWTRLTVQWKRPNGILETLPNMPGSI